MKKIILLSLMLSSTFINAQAYKGKGDFKGQMGLNLQKGGSGIVLSTDFGLGENMSYGFVASYILSNSVTFDDTAKFGDRIDAKIRFNANLGNVFKLDNKMDVYPGLDLGLRNFGVHLGYRYFFTDGFGLFAETGTPISSYNNDAAGLQLYNNQLYFNVGMSFNLE